MTDARRERWREHRRERREQFVAAAVRAVLTHGPDVGMSEIAAEAGITKPVLYRHFRDKEDLYYAVGMYATDRLMAELLPALAEEGTVQIRIRRAVAGYVSYVDHYRNLYRFVARRPIAGDRDIVAEDRSRIAEVLTTLLAGYPQVFTPSAGIAAPSAFGIVGMVEHATDWWLEHSHEMDREALIDHLTRLIWFGIDGLRSGREIVSEPEPPRRS